MRHNMGKTERYLRIIIGLALFAVSMVLGSDGIMVWQLISAFVAFALVITGVFAYCPVNAALRHNSCHACKIGETHAHLPV